MAVDEGVQPVDADSQVELVPVLVEEFCSVSEMGVK